MARAWTLLLVLLGGCADLGPGANGPAPPLGDTVPVIVASLLQNDLVAADPPVCLPSPAPLPAWHEVPRAEGGLVPWGTESLELVATLGGIWTGFQVGVRVDEGDFRWSPAIDQGSVTLDIDVRPDLHETDGPRWTFAWRSQMLEGQDCTAGAHSGSLALVVAAHVRN